MPLFGDGNAARRRVETGAAPRTRRKPMKKIALIVIAVSLVTSSARADGKMGGLGFRSASATAAFGTSGIVFTPSSTLGIRQWVSERIGLDGAVGFSTIKMESGAPATETADGNGFSFDLGMPF